MGRKVVVDDPDSAYIPFGCITPDALRHLANVIDRLCGWHREMHGHVADTPCLRRIEATGDEIIAHVSVGPPVGGSWERFVLTPHGWRLVTKDLPLRR